MVVMVAAAGCAARPLPHVVRQPRTPALLFDALPGWPTASNLALRSTWPSTLSYGSSGEDIYYRERFIDVQSGGLGFGRPYDRVYRRFDTSRTGRGHR